MVSLTGVYPISMVMTADMIKRLEERYIPPIGQYEKDLGEVVWFIPRNIEEKKTKNGKIYWILNVTDSSNKTQLLNVGGRSCKR